MIASDALSKDVSRRRSRAPIPSDVDVAIVGCGIGGLVAAGYLSQAGLRVACFDSHYVAGGCATQFARTGVITEPDGTVRSGHYHFDVGLHYIGDCEEGMIPRILRGLAIEQDFVPMDPDGFDTLVFPDFEFRIPVGIDAFRQRLVETFPSERRGIDRYVTLLRDVDRLGRATENRRGAAAMALTALRSLTAIRAREQTIGQFLDGCTRDPRLRAVLLGQSGDYGLPPSEVSALLHAGLSVHYFRGAHYPKGGGQILADRIADATEAAGGQIHLRCGIERITIENGRAVGLRTEPRRGTAHDVRARIVLSNADLKRTLLDLVGPEHLPAPYAKRAREFTMGGAIFMTFLGVRGDLRDLGFRKTNYWCFDDYDMERLYQDNRRSPEIHAAAAYITSASIKDPETRGHAPDGVQTLEIMSLVPGEARRWGVTDAEALDWGYKRDGTYKALKQRIEDDLIARTEALFPGVRDRIVYRESATPVSHTRFTRASDGTGYGLAATPAQFMKGRPGYRGPIPGLYLCGGSTRAGHGIVGAMMSGYHAARRVAGELGLRMKDV